MKRNILNVMLELLVVGVLCLAGCGGGGGGSSATTEDPPSADVTGTWIGYYTNSFGPQAAMVFLILQQSGNSVNGTFTDGGGSGSISGVVSGNTVSFTTTITTGCLSGGSMNGTGVVIVHQGDEPTMNFSLGAPDYAGAVSFACLQQVRGTIGLTKLAAPSVDVSGTWIGPYNSSVSGSQTGTLILQQSGDSISGTFSSPYFGSGNIFGAVGGNTASFTITFTNTWFGNITYGSFSGTGIVNVPQVGEPTMSFSYNGATIYFPSGSSSGSTNSENGTGNLTKQ